MTIQFSNNAISELASSLSSGGTSAVLKTGDGSKFATGTSSNPQYITLISADGTTYEIVKATGRSTDTLTITRAQESTSARDWAAGTTVFAGLTKGIVETFPQLDNGGNTKGTDAVNLQSTRTNVANVASGNYSISVGRDSKSSGTNSVAVGVAAQVTSSDGTCIGPNASVTGTNGVALGSTAVASGTSSTAIGYDCTATATSSVSLGTNSDATGQSSIAIGDGAISSNLYCTSIGYGPKATNYYDTAIGTTAICANDSTYTTRANTTAYALNDIIKSGNGGYVYVCVQAGTSAGSPPTLNGTSRNVTDGTVIWRYIGPLSGADRRTSIGPSSRSIGGRATSLGFTSWSAPFDKSFAGGTSSIAINGIATGAKSVGLSDGRAIHPYAIAIGDNSESRYNNSITTANFLPTLDTFPNWWHTAEYAYYGGLIGAFMSEPIDFTGGSTWAASTTYKHGRVVKPTVPNGWQYQCYDDNFIYGRIDDGVTYSGSSSGGSEPTWPTTAGNSVFDGASIDWVALQNSNHTIGPLPANFVVRSIGIIVYEYDTVTVQPSVSFGTTGNLTLFVNNQTTTGLTAANTAQFFNLTTTKAVPDVTIKIDTLATGTKLLCRVVFEGYYTKHWL